MIAVDTNVLVYAHREELPLHEVALVALRSLAEGSQPWALPIFCVGEFLRVVTHRRLFDPPTPMSEALEVIEALLESPVVRLLGPAEQYMPLLARMLRESGATGNLVFDAQIAALCVEHGARTLLTEDRDYARFSEITVQPVSSFTP